MGCVKRTTFRPTRRRFAICVLVLVISSHSTPVNAQGRKLIQTASSSKRVTEGSAIFRAQIGSRPPRCDRRCSSCPHCEAIQVPTNPQTRSGTTSSIPIAYARDDDEGSNYKPMSWKCKCGDLIFNP